MWHYLKGENPFLNTFNMLNETRFNKKSQVVFDAFLKDKYYEIYNRGILN